MVTVKKLVVAFIIPGLLNASSSRYSHPSPNQQIASFHYMTPISKTDFRNPGDLSLLKTFTATTAGTYTLVDQVGYQGASGSVAIGGNAAIFVQSNNVVVDLGGKTLYQNSTNSTTNGIEIASGIKNVTIKNGCLVGFNGAGILVNSGCDNIRIQNIVISSCGKQGILFSGKNLSGTSINNCIIDNTIVSNTLGMTGVANAIALELDYCQNIFVQNSVFCGTDGRSANANGIGVLVQNGLNIIFDHCDASANKGLNAYGFMITGTDTGTSACSFANCTAQNNAGSNSTGGNGYGFFTNLVSSCFWQECIAAGNTGTKNGFGFYSTSTSYSTFDSCEGAFNTAGSLATAATDGGRGFYSLNGLGNSYIKCIAKGNQGSTTNATTMGIGFNLETENYSLIDGCEARSNGSDTSLAWGVGINIANSSQIIVKQSKLFNNRSQTAAQGCGIRDTAIASTTLITDCFLFGNGQGTIANNFSIAYLSPGELNLTASVTVGGMGGISYVKPFQNITVTPS